MANAEESTARSRNLKKSIDRIASGKAEDILPADLRLRMQALIDAGISSFALTIPLHAKVLHFAEELSDSRMRRHVEAIFSHLFHWMEQLRQIPRGQLRAQKVHDLVDLAIYRSDQNAPTQLKASCRKGCSFCCHTRVAATTSEGELIRDFVEKHGIAYDRERAELQKDIRDPEVYARNIPWSQSACTFLNDQGECRIYPMRPTTCRKHAVVSDPRLCDPHEFNRPDYLVHLEAEIIASALYNIELDGKEEIPSLPELLWNAEISR